MSIDDGEQANLRKICDEIFGEENFVANIMWQKKYSPSNDHKTICPMHDFIMVYRKSDLWERNLLPRTEKNNEQYRHEDEKGVSRASDYTCNKTSQERPNLYYPIVNPNTGAEVWPKQLEMAVEKCYGRRSKIATPGAIVIHVSWLLIADEKHVFPAVHVFAAMKLAV